MRVLSVALAAGAAWTMVVPHRNFPGREVDLRTLTTVVGSAATATVPTGIISGDAILSAATGAVAAVIVPEVISARRDRSRRSEASRWPDLLAAIRARLGTGESVPAATLSAARRIGPPFDRLSASLESSGPGSSFAQSLNTLMDEWSDPIADRVLTTLMVADRVGGPRVAEVLAGLSSSVADDLRLRLAHEAATTEQRLTAIVALIAPWALLLLTVTTNPAAAESFSTDGGRLVILIGLGATATGYVLTRRSLRLSRSARPVA